MATLTLALFVMVEDEGIEPAAVEVPDRSVVVDDERADALLNLALRMVSEIGDDRVQRSGRVGAGDVA